MTVSNKTLVGGLIVGGAFLCSYALVAKMVEPPEASMTVITGPTKWKTHIEQLPAPPPVHLPIPASCVDAIKAAQAQADFSVPTGPANSIANDSGTLIGLVFVDDLVGAEKVQVRIQDTAKILTRDTYTMADLANKVDRAMAQCNKDLEGK